ncbi:Transcription factor ILI6 [Hibiscus syriacus]|uniref:Transcription factor ILI6 n=1 Tax=Hibiscus syriacus TaxID=106335 RepID=A0A6A2YTE8_HIBSY|nr:transcription factor PRE6-like [Hibiscus syriacus]KAE8682395.1 Transcription factor ILI6 [Hibiscus syriacus]
MSSKRSNGSRSNGNEDFSLRVRELSSTNKKKKRNEAKLLDETCNHIKKLNGEVDDLSNRISELLNSSEAESSSNANILRQLQQ